MEESLKQIVKETSKVLKYAKVHRQAQDTLDFLEQKNNFLSYKPYQIRARCLEAFQAAIESKNQRLASFAVTGIQHMLKDGQMHSSESQMKEEELEQWFPLQILAILHSTSVLSEDVQVDVMRLLLNMSLSLPQSMCAAVVINIIKLCIESLTIANRQTVRNFVFNTFLRMIHLFSVKASDPDSYEEMLETYYTSTHISVNTAVRGTFNQLLSSLNDRLQENDSVVVRGADDKTYIFPENTSAVAPKEEDFIAVFQYLCDNLSNCPGQSSPTEPLLLEGVLVLLGKLPPSISILPVFHDLIWQKLCPTLISILANPMNDKSLVVSKLPTAPSDEVGRGSGCSSNAPIVSSTSAKIIYSISTNLVRTLGRFASLRPVFESLFHRMLLYPCPAYRLDVIKSLKPLLSSPAGLVTLCGPMTRDDKGKSGGSKNKSISDMRLIKIIMDSLQECSHCSDSAVVVASVDLINEFLAAIDAMVQGSFSFHEGQESNDSKAESTNEEDRVVDEDVETKIASQNCEASEAECTKNLVKKFVNGLSELLSDMCKCSDVLFADDIVLNFSSRFCAEMNFEGSETILNADAVYVTSYSALHLSVNLYCSGYYSSDEKSLPVSQDQFINEVLSTGLLLYVSKSWLKEIFKLLISSDVLNLRRFAIDPRDVRRSAFLTLLNDLNGFNSHRLGGQLLTAFQDDLEALNATNYFLFHQRGHNLAHNILTQCWESILEVLSVLTSGKGSCSNSSLMLLFNAKEETKKMRLAICTSLEGLQKAARLSSILGLQNRSGSVFALLASASCVVELDDIKKEKLQQQQSAVHQADKLNNNNINKISSAIVPFATSITPSLTSFTSLTISSSSSFKPRLARLHAAHALSMDVLLGIGLEMGSHAYDCWKNVFKCCAHISELEHTYFTSNSRSLYSSMTRLQKSENNCTEFIPEDDGIESVEGYLSSAASSSEPVAQQINVKEVVEQSRLESGWDINVAGGGILSSKQASKVLCGLSQEVDKLFEDAATKLNMKALVEFLSELCKSSEAQLASLEDADDSLPHSILPTNALHLYRLADIMNRCMSSKRPLLHIMKAWSIISHHLTKAACHKDRMISKKAVSCIHEIVTSLLSSRQELPLFHFNEFLCKPFENLLCLELCDGDIQDQIVCSICELVEACPCNMKSGWKPLFNALRSVKIECTSMEEVNAARQRHVEAVLDVFDVFLGTDNVLVFANAAVDCILCLLRYVRGPGEFKEEDSDSDEDLDEDSFEGAAYNNLCLPALKYLKQCADCLASMWILPSTPVFSGAQRIHSFEFQTLPLLPNNMDSTSFVKVFYDLEGTAERGASPLMIKTSNHASENVVFEKKMEDENFRHHDKKNGTIPSVTADGIKTSDDKTNGEKMSSTKQVESDVAEPAYIDARLSNSNDELSFELERNYKEFDGMLIVQSNSLEDLKNELVEDGNISSGNDDVKRQSSEDGSVTSRDPLLSIDNSSGILHVYHLLIEGLTNAVFECSKNYQPQTLETLFELIRSSANNPGPQFAFHCFNNILLPTLQSWTRKSQTFNYWNAQMTSNCKHFTGLSVDLLVGFIIRFVDDATLSENLEFMLHQQMAILIDFIAQPVEFLSRLGCSCIRHCLMNCGYLLSQKMWDIVVEAMRASFDVTLFNLRCLMMPFHDNSDSFYGDEGQVKVATRRDSTPADSEKLRRLSHQVFLLDCQQDQNFSEFLVDKGNDKSFVFLIYSPDSLKRDVPLIRIPFRSLVISLVSHQLLIQTLGSLLLNGTSNMVTPERVILHEVPARQFPNKVKSLQNLALPGMLEVITCQHAISLLECLKVSFKAAEEFDQKPGLKFLIQKILGSDVSANLYRHAGLGMTLYVHALLEVVSCHSLTFQQKKKEGNHCVESNCNLDSKYDSSHSSGGISGKILSSALETARHLDLNVFHFIGLFAGLLREALDDICSKYVNLFLEKEGSSISDRLSQSMLVFLPVEHDDLPTLKREWSLKDAVTEKLKRSSSLEVNEANNLLTPNGFNRKSSKEVFCDEALPEVPSKDDLKSMELVDMSSLDQQLKLEADDKICKLASDNTLKTFVGEYRKRKQSKSMPASSNRIKLKDSTIKSELYQEINRQQKSSYLKDSEAHLRSRAEVLCNILQLLDQLNNKQFTAMLPIFHQFLVDLTKHSADAQLRLALSRWISRIGHIYNFAGLCSTE